MKLITDCSLDIKFDHINLQVSFRFLTDFIIMIYYDNFFLDSSRFVSWLSYTKKISLGNKGYDYLINNNFILILLLITTVKKLLVFLMILSLVLNINLKAHLI